VNDVMLNFKALFIASTALLGEQNTKVLSELYTLLDKAEKGGYEEGYTTGTADNVTSQKRLEDAYKDGNAHSQANYDEGYRSGHDDGFDDGYAEGYRTASEVLGECPIVDQDWDWEDDSDSHLGGYLRGARDAGDGC
jgi:hypothetical protein